MASLVSDSRFKTISVLKKCSIKALVNDHSLAFKKGRGFYQLTKPEVVQDYKEVIVRRKTDGTFLTGERVRDVLGIPKSSAKFKLDLEEISDFDVFVQSTSVNRALLVGTEFLYEVDTGSGDGGGKASAVSPNSRLFYIKFYIIIKGFKVQYSRFFMHVQYVLRISFEV